MKKNSYLKSILLSGILGFTSISQAAYEIAPVKLAFDAKTRVASVTIKNTNAEETSFQTTVLKMVKKNGRETWEQTKDMVIVTPAVFRVPSNKSQLVRLAVRGPIDNNTSDKYTLSVKELPKHGPKVKETGGANVQLITDFRVPIVLGS